LTGIGVVTTVYSDLAVIDVTSQGFVIREMVEGLTLDELQEKTGAPVRLANDWRRIATPVPG